MALRERCCVNKESRFTPSQSPAFPESLSSSLVLIISQNSCYSNSCDYLSLLWSLLKTQLLKGIPEFLIPILSRCRHGKHCMTQRKPGELRSTWRYLCSQNATCTPSVLSLAAQASLLANRPNLPAHSSPNSRTCTLPLIL